MRAGLLVVWLPLWPWLRFEVVVWRGAIFLDLLLARSTGMRVDAFLERPDNEHVILLCTIYVCIYIYIHSLRYSAHVTYQTENVIEVPTYLIILNLFPVHV